MKNVPLRHFKPPKLANHPTSTSFLSKNCHPIGVAMMDDI